MGKDRNTRRLAYRDRWAYRTLYTDWFVEWLSPFMAYCSRKKQVKAEYLHFLSDDECAKQLHKKWCVDMKKEGKDIKQAIWKLTIEGMAKYGLQLVAVELCTIAGIYLIRDIIDYLHDQEAPHSGYNWLLFLSFGLFRLLAILIRNYYDLHVYNFYRYVQTAI